MTCCSLYEGAVGGFNNTQNKLITFATLDFKNHHISSLKWQL